MRVPGPSKQVALGIVSNVLPYLAYLVFLGVEARKLERDNPHALKAKKRESQHYAFTHFPAFWVHALTNPDLLGPRTL